MATLTLWESFSKRENSTKTPATAGTEKNVKLKENVSVSSPIFIINEVNTLYSYAKFDDRYYFVNDIVIINSTQSEIHCVLDVLGTYKTDILLTSAFVKYHSHNNTEITDARLSTKTTQSTIISEATFDTLGGTTPANSACVVTIVGENSTGQFAISQNDLKNIFSSSMASDWSNDMEAIERSYPYEYEGDIMAWLHNIANYFARGWEYLKLLFNWSNYKGNALNCVKSAIQVPLSKNDCGGIEQDITIGGVVTEIRGYLITDRIFSDSATVNIPWQANDWRRNAPYHEIFLYIPWVGVINISPSDVIDEETITVHASVDKYTGDITIVAKAGVKTIFYGGASAGSTYPIGSSNVAPIPLASSIVQTGIGVMSQNPVMATSGFIGIANNIQPNFTCIGGSSGASALGLNANKIYCYTIYHDTTVPPANVSVVQGTPTNAVLALSTITGYVQTINASVNGDMELSEKQKINSMLDSGIYIE